MESIKPNQLIKYREFIEGYDIYSRHLVLTEADAIVYQILCLFFTKRGANHESLNTSFHIEDLKFKSMNESFMLNKSAELNAILRDAYPGIDVSAEFSFGVDPYTSIETLLININISGEIFKTQLGYNESFQVTSFNVTKDFTS